jgi:hypothetical protein
MSYLNYSVPLPDHGLLPRVKAAALTLGIAPGAFFRQAAEKAVEQHEKKREKKPRQMPPRNIGNITGRFTIALPDHGLLDRVKAAAEDQGISPGAFFRQAAEKAVAQHEKKRDKKQQTRAA